MIRQMFQLASGYVLLLFTSSRTKSSRQPSLVRRVQLTAHLRALPLSGAAVQGSLPALRALDSHPGSDVFVAGTSCCDVWEVDADPEVLVHGHAGSVLCVACHPSKPHLLVSVDDKGHVFVWNANMRTLVRSCAYVGLAKSPYLLLVCGSVGADSVSMYPLFYESGLT